jgi:HD-GYP domain-containing protein (c-di-GMP phosphodiesterase class II)
LAAKIKTINKITDKGNSAISIDLFWHLIDIGVSLTSERNTTKLLDRILREAQSITNADGGTLYLVNGDDKQAMLEYIILKTTSLNFEMGGTSGKKVLIPGLRLYDQETGEPNHNSVATHVMLTGESVNIEDAYDVKDYDFSGAKNFDKKNNYRSKSFLCVPLKNHEADVIGVIQLINATNPDTGSTISFAKEIEPIIQTLCSFAAISLDNQRLIQSHKDLFDSIVKVIAQAIDAKSPFTSGHCIRVPELTEMIAAAAAKSRMNTFKDFALDENQWFELRIAAWLHDCGKLSTPDHILDKETKLQTIRDGIDNIKSRFEILLRDAEINYLKKLIENPAENKKHMQEYEHLNLKIIDDLNFIVKCNPGSEFMNQKDKERVREIGNTKWCDSNGTMQELLSEEDVYNLSIERGTLNLEERKRINDHIVVTIDMLNSLPFPKNMKDVPEIAGGHHEKMNGTGYPSGLKGEDMSIPARIMALADIFEALTAQDRPYKEPMPLSIAFNIIRSMAGDHLDPNIVKLFLKSGVWKVYSEKYLLQDQIDVTDISIYIKGL